jgi:UDP-glucose 4-epimerase
MLRDTAAAHPLRYVVLRYFNVAGADPNCRSGQSTRRATHLIKVATQTALGERDHVEIFGDDYPTTDGTCVRDYIHVSDLVNAHVLALDYLGTGGASTTLNCGYGRGYSVLEVIEAVKRVSGINFKTCVTGRRNGDPATLVAGVAKIQEVLKWHPTLDNLETIIAHALAWEESLASRQGRAA